MDNLSYMVSLIEGEDEEKIEAKNFNVFAAAFESQNYRQVVATGKELQMSIMTINVGDDIGSEVHEEEDQALLIIDGMATVIIGKEKTSATSHHLIFVPKGLEHNVINQGNTPLRILSIYAPPEHPPNTVHATKDDDPHH